MGTGVPNQLFWVLLQILARGPLYRVGQLEKHDNMVLYYKTCSAPGFTSHQHTTHKLSDVIFCCLDNVLKPSKLQVQLSL